MAREIRQSDLRNDNASIMRRVANGESFIVTVNGRAVADVVPHQRSLGKRSFMPVSELVAAFAADPAPDPATWQADLDAADDVFGPDEISDPWDRR